MWGLPAPFPAEHNHHGVVLIIAFEVGGFAVFVCDDGQLRRSDIDSLRTEWRFNWNTHVWEDEQEGDLNEDSSDGSPEIPGDIPESDDADGGHPGDEGDGAPGSVVPE